LSPLHKEGN